LRAQQVRADELRRVEDVDDDKTIVDAFPLLPSEPPKDAKPDTPPKPKRRS
jgi:hypothetical protein